MDAPTATAVVGMPRSGKVVVARLLEELGVDLGRVPELRRDLREHRGLVRISEEVLAALGAGWDAPPSPTDPRWEDGPRFDRLRSEARGLIERHFAGSGAWAWKDPRATLALPFWREVIPALGCLLCVRQPSAVAHELRARDNIPVRRGALLWACYTVAALIHTRGARRDVVIFERLLDRPATVLDEVARSVGVSVPEGAREAAERLADPSEVRALESAWDAEPDAVPRPVVEAYEALSSRGLAAEREVRRLLEPLLGELGTGQGRGGWQARRRRALDELRDAVPEGAALALADGAALGEIGLRAREVVRVVERDAVHVGNPADDGAALAEIDRLRRRGVGYLAIAWPCFWWRDVYPALFAHLEEHAVLVRSTQQVMLFQLRRGRAGTR